MTNSSLRDRVVADSDNLELANTDFKKEDL